MTRAENDDRGVDDRSRESASIRRSRGFEYRVRNVEERRDRSRLTRTFTRNLLFSRTCALMLLGIVASVFVLFWVDELPVPRMLRRTMHVAMLIVAWFGGRYVVRKQERVVREVLREDGRCENCGYLRGDFPGEVCPECGERFRAEP